MKAKTLYTCELCHTDYADRQDAIRCEATHQVKLTIAEAKYQPVAINRGGFPIRITLRGENGRSALYEKRGESPER